ncbi:MAG: MFS transporter [Ignavibacteriae bacterium]|nr:MAG: MFS transporter [Ignavibacteriota bacterium]
MNSLGRPSRNERLHIIEGALYISTSALISTQTMMPALIKRLGGGDVLVGTWPVVVYLAYFLPQVITANYSVASKYRRSGVLKYGFIQRMHILLLACIIALWGASWPALVLTCLFLLYLSNQATSGCISPLWMDFLVKTTDPERRGKIMGWRVSLGAVLALVNGFILTALLTWLRYPYNYASAIGLAFLLQMGSWGSQTKILESAPSPVSTPVHLSDLFSHVQTIVKRNPSYKKFLLASALLIISFSSAAFFTIAAIKRFAISEYVVGVFTIMMILGQIISGLLLGWLADSKGTKSALVVCGISLVLAIALAWLAPSVTWYYFVFLIFGINAGSETAMRYNFAVECAPLGERPMYVGLMNAWFAPFYLFTPLAGLLAATYGYNLVFAISLITGLAGIVVLLGTPNPRFVKLALSSK